MNNKCQREGHSQKSLITVCLAAKCKKERRVCCFMCQTEFHKDHIEQLVDFECLLSFIKTQSQKPIRSSLQVIQAIKELNIVLKHIEDLIKLIQEEIKRLGSANLQTFCKNLGNSYDIFTEQVANQQWNDLVQEMLSQVKLKKCEIIEKDPFEAHFGKPYSQFMKQFSQTITKIVQDIAVVNYVLDPKYPISKLTVPHVLEGHTDRIFAIDICEKRNLLVSGSRDNKVKLWNLKDNTLLMTYEDINFACDAVFSSEGRFLAYGGGRTIIHLIELKDFKDKDIVSQLNGHSELVTRLTFSNDEIYLISGSYDLTVRVWKIQAKEQLFKFDSGSTVFGLTMSRDNTLIASHTYSKGIKIWNIKNQKLLCTQKGHTQGAGIQFSSDQQMLVSSGDDGLIKLWSLKELDQGKLSLIMDFKAANRKIQRVLLTDDSRFIISYCWEDGEVKVMDSNTGEQLKLFKIQKEGDYDHQGLAITKKMNMLAYGDGNNIIVWRIE